MISGSDFAALTDDVTAIGYRDLMGEKFQRRHRKDRSIGSGNFSDESRAESGDVSDGDESSTSSSSTASTALKDWNGIRDLAGSRGLKATTAHCSGFLCGLLMMQRGVQSHPSDENLDDGFGGSQEEKR